MNAHRKLLPSPLQIRAPQLGPNQHPILEILRRPLPTNDMVLEHLLERRTPQRRKRLAPTFSRTAGGEDVVARCEDRVGRVGEGGGSSRGDLNVVGEVDGAEEGDELGGVESDQVLFGCELERAGGEEEGGDGMEDA